MAGEKPREVELYCCNKYFLRTDAEEVVFCNAPQYCDPETRQRRHCVKVKVVILWDQQA
ncbi:MAG: hypothetical protein ACM3X6_00040 [Patescibacteria group bacterium]